MAAELGCGTNLELAKRLGKTPQAFYRLERATDRTSLRNLVALRHLEGRMTDTRLLDVLEEEANLDDKPTRRPSRPKIDLGA